MLVSRHYCNRMRFLYHLTVQSPIHTYSGQATLKENLPDPQQHAIIYTSSRPPHELCINDEYGGTVQEELSKDPIRVIRELNDVDGDLGELSRINYAKIYTVEKYVRVLNIGRVHQDSMESLLASCFFARPVDEPPQGPRKSKHDKSSKDREGKEDKGQGSKSHHHRKKH